MRSAVTTAVLGILVIPLSVLLAFMVIAVWEQYEMARNTEDQEANELAEIYWLANQFPESERQQLQELAQSYGRVMIEEPTPTSSGWRTLRRTR